MENGMGANSKAMYQPTRSLKNDEKTMEIPFSIISCSLVAESAFNEYLL
jgi:hypothetical protein